MLYQAIAREAGEKRLEFIKRARSEYMNASTPAGRVRMVDMLGQALIDVKAESIFERHRDALKRKYRQAVWKDDYGLLVKDKWELECAYFIRRILLPELSLICKNDPLCMPYVENYSIQYQNDIDYWTNFVTSWVEMVVEFDVIDKAYAEDEDDKVYLEYDDTMTGLEYEEYIEALAYNYGWEPRRTAASGDHGADVIITHGEVRVAIQCKKYSLPVGNKSVQEIYSAKDFYECDHAVVVTNSSFTKSARQVADSLKVYLVHHDELEKCLEPLSSNSTELLIKRI